MKFQGYTTYAHGHIEATVHNGKNEYCVGFATTNCVSVQCAYNTRVARTWHPVKRGSKRWLEAVASALSPKGV